MHLIANADARRLPLADGSVHCVVTSPPYMGLRDYKCKGQIGLEGSTAEYVAELVGVFREVRRVLRHDGVCWLNLGDSYSQGNNGAACGVDPKQSARRFGVRPNENGGSGVSGGNLIGVPWRVALTLQADGWILRSEIIWHKRSPMPESVKTRPTRAHEHVFLLAKSPKYFYDWYAVMEKQAPPSGGRQRAALRQSFDYAENEYKTCNVGRGHDGLHKAAINPAGRNLRSVWTLSSEPFPGSHFATFPRKLVVPCIKAGTSARGCCPACGAQWVREVESEGDDRAFGRGQNPGQTSGASNRTISGIVPSFRPTRVSKLGFRQSCPCSPHEPVPSVVLDPFGGAGTVPLVAEALGRRGIATELNPDYCRMALQRIRRPHKRHTRPDDGRPMPLFSGLSDP